MICIFELISLVVINPQKKRVSCRIDFLLPKLRSSANQTATHCRHCNLRIQRRFDLHLNENENILIAYYSKQTEVYCKEILYSSEFHAKGDHNKRLTEEMKKNNTGNPKSVLEFNMCLVLLPMQ